MESNVTLAPVNRKWKAESSALHDRAKDSKCRPPGTGGAVIHELLATVCGTSALANVRFP